MSDFHTPVLLKEVISFLQVNPGKKYIDATIGGGSHSQAILSLGGRVLGIDTDQEAIEYVQKKLRSEIKNQELILEKGNFRNLGKIAHLNEFDKVSGILFDLGVSSYQIDTPQRGFSFLREGPLDMRMDKELPVTADALVNLLGKGKLYELFSKLGQEHRARIISNSIIRARRVEAIKTTTDLTNIIAESYGYKGEIPDFKKNQINQKVFQALRVAVNNELENLENALPQALSLLEKDGRIAVISFHSLEDGIVKRAFKNFEQRKMGKIINEKPIEASLEEIRQNSRSKGAKLRVFQKN